MIPPLSKEDWQSEFDKYASSPEYKKLRDAETFGMSDFKR